MGIESGGQGPTPVPSYRVIAYCYADVSHAPGRRGAIRPASSRGNCGPELRSGAGVQHSGMTHGTACVAPIPRGELRYPVRSHGTESPGTETAGSSFECRSSPPGSPGDRSRCRMDSLPGPGAEILCITIRTGSHLPVSRPTQRCSPPVPPTRHGASPRPATRQHPDGPRRIGPVRLRSLGLYRLHSHAPDPIPRLATDHPTRSPGA